MPHARRSDTAKLPTREEWPSVLDARLQTLDNATQVVTGSNPLPPAWRVGWTCHVAFLGRDRDGSLLISLTARGPGLARPYVRRVRLVRHALFNRKLR